MQLDKKLAEVLELLIRYNLSSTGIAYLAGIDKNDRHGRVNQGGADRANTRHLYRIDQTPSEEHRDTDIT